MPCASFYDGAISLLGKQRGQVGQVGTDEGKLPEMSNYCGCGGDYCIYVEALPMTFPTESHRKRRETSIAQAWPVIMHILSSYGEAIVERIR